MSHLFRRESVTGSRPCSPPPVPNGRFASPSEPAPAPASAGCAGTPVAWSRRCARPDATSSRARHPRRTDVFHATWTGRRAAAAALAHRRHAARPRGAEEALRAAARRALAPALPRRPARPRGDRPDPRRGRGRRRAARHPARADPRRRRGRRRGLPPPPRRRGRRGPRAPRACPAATCSGSAGWSTTSRASASPSSCARRARSRSCSRGRRATGPPGWPRTA